MEVDQLINIMRLISKQLKENPDNFNKYLDSIEILLKLYKNNEIKPIKNNNNNLKLDFIKDLIDNCIIGSNWITSNSINLVLLINCLGNIDENLKSYIQIKFKLSDDHINNLWNCRYGNYGFSSFKWIAKKCNKKEYDKLFKLYFKTKINDDLCKKDILLEGKFKIDYLIDLYNEMYGDINVNCNNKFYLLSNDCMWTVQDTISYTYFEEFNNIMKQYKQYKLFSLTVFSRLLREKYNHADFTDKLNMGNHLAFNNGLYNFKVNKFIDILPEDYISITTGYNYIKYDDYSEDILNIKKILKEIFPKEVNYNNFINLAKKIVKGDKDINFYNFLGSGSNGKSVILDFLVNSLGEYAQVGSPNLLSKKYPAYISSLSNAPLELAYYQHKKLIIIPELEHNDTISNEKLKQYLNETVSIRLLYNNEINTFKLNSQLIMASNKTIKLEYLDPEIIEKSKTIFFENVFTTEPQKGQYKSKFIDCRKLRNAFIHYILDFKN